MARALKAKRFTSALVPFVLTLVRRAGKDATRLEKKYLRGGQPEVSLPELGALLSDAAKVLGDPLFGLHAALGMSRGSYGLLEFGLRSAPTGRLAMEQLAKYGALINPLVRWSLEVDGDEISLHHRAPRKGGVGKQGNVFTVARILRIAREMMGDDLMPVRAWFAHDEKSCPPEVAAHLGTRHISFGRASNGLSFSAKDLERVPAGADPELNRALELHGAAVLARCADDIAPKADEEIKRGDLRAAAAWFDDAATALAVCPAFASDAEELRADVVRLRSGEVDENMVKRQWAAAREATKGRKGRHNV